MREYSILIVDDEPENLQAMYAAIVSSGGAYKIIKAASGKIAYQAAIKRLPDIIITDWEMPEMNGIELIKQLKRTPETADIPVIMCTGIMTSSENLKTALDIGAIDYLRKPVDEIELSARISASLQLAGKYAEVKELNRIKDQIFSVIAHDLRSPVGTIRSFAQLIQENTTTYNLPQDIKNFVDYIEQQSNVTLSTLSNLLAWAQTQSNSVSYHPQDQAIMDTIVHSISLLNGAAIRKGIRLKNEVKYGITATFDIDLISIVVRNLINNAIKFTATKGEVRITAHDDDEQLIIAVADTGVGIAPEQLKTLFNKTTYDTSYGTDNEKGSGLGLKLCADIIAKHKGKIWAESTQGVGSVFSFSLPKG